MGCAKIRAAGKKIYHLPGATVVHHGGGSTAGQFSKFSTAHFCQSVCQFIRAHRGAPSAAAYRALLFLSAVLRLALLYPATLLTRSSSRTRSRQKWQTILRWCLGLESWVTVRSLPAVPSTPKQRPLASVT